MDSPLSSAAPTPRADDRPDTQLGGPGMSSFLGGDAATPGPADRDPGAAPPPRGVSPAVVGTPLLTRDAGGARPWAEAEASAAEALAAASPDDPRLRPPWAEARAALEEPRADGVRGAPHVPSTDVHADPRAPHYPPVGAEDETTTPAGTPSAGPAPPTRGAGAGGGSPPLRPAGWLPPPRVPAAPPAADLGARVDPLRDVVRASLEQSGAMDRMRAVLRAELWRLARGSGGLGASDADAEADGDALVRDAARAASHGAGARDPRLAAAARRAAAADAARASRDAIAAAGPPPPPTGAALVATELVREFLDFQASENGTGDTHTRALVRAHAHALARAHKRTQTHPRTPANANKYYKQTLRPNHPSLPLRATGSPCPASFPRRDWRLLRRCHALGWRGAWGSGGSGRATERRAPQTGTPPTEGACLCCI